MRGYFPYGHHASSVSRLDGLPIWSFSHTSPFIN
nr:MAG TPA: hypothetical protein [Caudoviricetes sp.]